MNSHGTDVLTLLARPAEVAHRENITLDELVSDAVERRLNRRELSTSSCSTN